MTAEELLNQNIRFSLVGGSVEIDGDGALIDALLPEIRRLKPELIVLLSANDESRIADDRHYCRQCLNYSVAKRCMVFKEVQQDDIPRRCDQFRANNKPSPLGRLEESAIRAWLQSIGETDAALIEETVERCRTDSEARRCFLMRSDDATQNLRKPEFSASTGRTCQECRYWQRDTIGNASGLGACLINAVRHGLPWPNQDACTHSEGI